VPTTPQLRSTGEEQPAPSTPAITLPKGGGAIRGIGEKFATNPVTGTGSMEVPLPTSPGRSGFGPHLSLSYDSGSGNGPFGFGWRLSLPAITRKTDKGLPLYRDAEESDVYILSGAEDLVPVLGPDGVPFKDDATAPGYVIHRYRPRVEGLFARIERWTSVATGEIFWRSISRDNVTTLYGNHNNARIFDPADSTPANPTRVFSWLICESYDDKGNAIVYDYAEENEANVDLGQTNERNRVRAANRYLKRIKYGNRVSRLIQPNLTQAGWMFEVVFDYDEDHYDELDLDPLRPEAEQHRYARASAAEGRPWAVRSDAFSLYRAGFEVRTYRRCRRVLMFHHIPDLPTGEKGYDGLVRSTEFDYADLDYSHPPGIEAELAHQGSTRFAAFIRRITQSGFVRDDAHALINHNGAQYPAYLKESLPPLEFKYSRASIQDEVLELDRASLENLPVGLDGTTYQSVDLDGEGVSGILTEQAGGWFYKSNLGDGRFGALQTVGAQPSLADLSGGRQQLLDLAGDGQLDLVALAGPAPGFYERTKEGGWEQFRVFPEQPNITWDEPNLRLVDLNGDGHGDVLITEQDVITWHPSLAEDGFGPARSVRQSFDEERGPRLLLADGTQSIYLADMCGDGLTDLVRIRNGEVCYWPSLGYGRFGAKVTMDNGPWLDNADQFDQRRVRLADVDGSGTNDIIYLARDGVRLYFNQSGNRLSDVRRLAQFPNIDNISSVLTADLLGNGTACLVWSSHLPADAGRPLRYIDLMGGTKPHLLTKSTNNLGAETQISYAPSTRFYLADKSDGRPWVTRLPFPVHVVERVVTDDRISGNRFVTRYAYHHGYFDGIAREFRGFGMVDQFDTEELSALTGETPPVDFEEIDAPTADGTPSAPTNVDQVSHVPPVHTRTWFHTGAFLDKGEVSPELKGEYYRPPGLDDQQFQALIVPDSVLPSGLALDEQLEACRSLKGAMLRQEVYADDSLPGSTEAAIERAKTPYTVTEQNFTVHRLQPRDGNRPAVFLTHAREAITYHYERNPSDPRIQHALTLQVDEYGNVLRSVSVGYPRRNVPERRPEQNETHLTLELNRVVNRDDRNNWYRVGLPVETRTYELVKPPGATERFAWEEINDLITALVPLSRHEPSLTHTVPYEQWDWRKDWDPQTEPGGLVNGIVEHSRLRMINHFRTLYRKDSLIALLPLAEVESLALAGESYQLVFTPGLLAHIFKREQTGVLDEDLLPNPGPLLEGNGGDQGGHVMMDGNWWIPSGRAFFDPAADVSNPANTAALELAAAREHFYLPRKVADPFDQSTVVYYDGPADPNKPRYDLLVTSTADALGNTITATNDYRVLQPLLVTDSNGNRTAVAFDALGFAVATAVMGKKAEPDGIPKGDQLEDFDADPPLASLQAFVAEPRVQAESMLGKATIRIVYDLERCRRAGQPPFAATLSRETHLRDPGGAQTKIQISFSYSDGLGREIQKKIQAEAGDAPRRQPDVILPTGDISPGDMMRDAQGKLVQANTPHRWVGSGRTVFNNKGKPVRRYEPFVSDTQLYEPERDMTDTGVSPVLFYDPVQRVVATLHPNHAYEKVVFDPWQQSTHDVNDTIAASDAQTGDPRTDWDIKGYVAEYFRTQPEVWRTWYEERISGAKGEAEKSAAEKAAAHADTPTVAHLDSLGRTFLTVAYNRFARNGATVEEQYETRVNLDGEGNQRELIDAKNRIVMRYDYEMLGNRIHHASMEAGERWSLNEVTGKPIRAWDSRGFRRRITYDELRRPIALFVLENGVERLAERTVYGEGQGAENNHRTRVFRIQDGAGVLTSEGYDFKGNLLRSKRELLPNYKSGVDWQQNPTPNDGTFASSTTFDALNRPITATAPDKSVYRPTYNDANLLDQVKVNLRDSGTSTPFVTNVDYNARSQRTCIRYANGAKTTFEYDEQTFRLIHLKTTRAPGQNGLGSSIFKTAAIVQDLRYTYDPAGNITRIADDALPVIVHDNQPVEPVCDYTYDAIYRLSEAKGREHIGQTAYDLNPPEGDARDYPFVGYRVHPNDMQALRRYTEICQYDAVGNLEMVRHHANDGSWTRRYDYGEDSLIEADEKSNRLTRTRLGNGVNYIENYVYGDAQGNDVHGCLTAINSMGMTWDFEDQLRQVDLGGGGSAYYVYDAGGQRVRKVIETQTGTPREERLYLGNFETYRTFGANALVRETLSVMDDKQRITLIETKTYESGSQVPNPLSLIRYQLGNHIGSTSLELDQSAGLISYAEYHPYGTTAYEAMSGAVEVSLKRYRYTGKERDEETGLYYYGARYYAPWLGRWTSCDPARLADGVNTYAYVRNNPIGLLDPTGHQGIKFKSQEEERKWREGQRLPGSMNPDEIGDVYQAPKDVPENLVSRPPSPDTAAKQRVRLGVGAAKREVAKSEAERHPPLTREEKWQVAKESAWNWALDRLSVNPSTAAVFPILVPNALLTHFVLDPLRASEPPERATNLREYQLRSSYDFMQGTLDTAELGIGIVPAGEILQAGRLAFGKLPMLEGVGMGGGGRLIGFSEQWAAEAAGGATPVLKEGSFSVIDWTGYPEGRPRPTGPFRLVEGHDYDAARFAANEMNFEIRARTEGLAGRAMAVHEIQPVKFGGNPTDWANKELISDPEHWEVSKFWAKLQRDMRF
jgi:RHS repeat-associated protein